MRGFAAAGSTVPDRFARWSSSSHGSPRDSDGQRGARDSLQPVTVTRNTGPAGRPDWATEARLVTVICCNETTASPRPAGRPTRDGKGADVEPSVSVLHWFDFICPFCYVGQQRDDILERRGLDVVHLPFQIHPEIPDGGVEAGPRNGPMYAALEREAAAAGLALNWPERLPNTRRALAAAEWIRLHQPAVSGDFNKALFAARFVHGEEIGDRAVVEQHAGRVGVDLEALRAALDDGTALAALAESESLGVRLGVRATPTWLIGGEVVSGLLPQAEFERLAEKAISRA
ncbi:hypothetical protein D7147_10390 [Micromonospora musae]|uniref:DSBA-like thioredoxin domain-containing protein n=1 Tax=Micromonospora musae TaxID=1894970 RepID=A0ABX9RD18_9ACTN|nr:hypothetical protein D7147_10390 [Micromonospora musae]